MAGLRNPRRWQKGLRRVTLRQTFENGSLAQVVEHLSQNGLGFVLQEVVGLRILAVHAKDRHSLHRLLPPPQSMRLRKFSQLLFHASPTTRSSGTAMARRNGAGRVDGVAPAGSSR